MILDQHVRDRKVRSFSLSPKFLDKFKGRQPKWGPVGYVTYKRTYSRPLPEGGTEEWWQTSQRVVEGAFMLQKIHCRHLNLPWDDSKAQKSAQDMYQRMWDFKFLPPGRGLWMMGTDYIYKQGSACLTNCSFISSDMITEDFAGPFCYLMDMSMMGVGVGTDTRGAGKVKIQEPKTSEQVHVVEDSREGWVELMRTVLNSFVGKEPYPLTIDYSQVRGMGLPIKGFGGLASGPKPLKDLILEVTKILLPDGMSVSVDVEELDSKLQTIGKVTATFSGGGEPYPISSTKIVDIFNHIGCCVVAGNVRRTAEVIFGDADDKEFMALKQDKVALESHRWASNNSIFAKVGMDYSDVVDAIAVNGEPGLIWLDSAQRYSRMDGHVDNKDARIKGFNPCFTGDTLIAVADGRNTVSLKQLADEGNDVPVYSMDKKTGMVEIKMGRNPRLTRENAELVKITFDDDSTLKVTPDHKMVLLTGEEIEAQDLKSGDSLPRFNKRQEQITKKNPKKYWRMSCNTRDSRKSRIMEHRLIAQFNDSKKWSDSFTPVIRKKLSDKMVVQKREMDMAYYKEQEANTDLNTTWIDGKLCAVKVCEKCGVEFIVSWREREKSYCSRQCSMAVLAESQKRKDNVRAAFNEKQRQILHKQIMVLKDLQGALGRDPFKKEWEKTCKDQGIPFRFQADSPNPYVMPGYKALKERSVEYNHRVKSVEFLTETENVYNITVDDFHTVGIVTFEDSSMISGIYCTQCGEQGLESAEACNLVETFPAHHDSPEDYKATLKMAYLYAKTVTLVPTHNPIANAVMMRNRRIGCSMSGITQAMDKFGRRDFLTDYCDAGYNYIQELDQMYSEWLCVPRSIKMSTVKPSGSVSLLAGATPGIHFPHSEYYIRRIRMAQNSPLIDLCRDSGLNVVQDVYSSDTMVVEFPVHEKHFRKGKSDVTVWEQFINMVDLQRYWSDNAVSCTVSFKKEEVSDLKGCLETFDDRLKGVSLLPLNDHGYKLAPYETIDAETYHKLADHLKPLVLDSVGHEVDDEFCSNDTCELELN